MIATSRTQVFEPRTLREALDILHGKKNVTVLAGCTDVFVNMHFGTVKTQQFLNLWPLNELRGIRARRGTLHIGALTTFTELIESRSVQALCPMLVAASREIGGVQIQNRGTIGGNIANASPAGDSLPVLAAADARIRIQSLDTERTVPISEFYLGYRKTALRQGELITAIEIPPIDGRQWFVKVGTRAAQAISKVVMAGIRGDAVRVALGSVGPTVLRAYETEKVLSKGGSLARAQEALLTEIAPIDDMRSTAEYRKRVASNLLTKFWRETSDS